MTEHLALTLFYSTILGALAGWIAARAEHFDIVRRLESAEGFLRAWHARTARAEKKVKAEDIIREFVSPVQTPEQILAEATRKGLM